MASKGGCIAHNFGERAKITAASMAFMFVVGYGVEGFHYHPEMHHIPTFAQPQWSAKLPPHVPATAPNTVAVYVVLPPPR
jgi:hypothetical protein